ncbi:hypothetical protein GUITHDRAFT_165818 [Guillardia theta CCMP2712]|uniref:O-GlcNAc transferase C-terminal domain-containing protein n=2 Tax=Guillardia theta TaxID=55529 RepID=L1IIL2_GUITC|nr:hypothetical protein GUITHDRAFT_165818 [Guillardia theta CCMP2712]EKX36071.1 hypothetical protein GUITHDRAFT_165818 [Guillardia theta CCMP2712]|eukprot:XP_005823051.1 hypothetical protein GUITHDRAFT_165818 [Guillardia theta CCMP2712]
MDPHAYALAFGRQAPVQLAMHGHASTTGVDSIDYYVSYQGFSEPQAQTHYSEKLIVLDGFTPLTRFYEEFPFNVSPAMKTEDGRLQFRSRYNIPPRATVYACLQTIFKVSPKMDFVAKRILNEDPNSIIMFKELPMTDQCGKQVLERMRNKSKLTEDEMARIKFLPAMHDADYSDMFAIVDVILDSYPFGGHTTSMEALAVGRPIVTLPTDFMSGRCTQGFLAFLGLQELIASDLEDFIRIAVKLGKDAALRERISSTIIKGFSALIKDDRSVRGWSQVLEILVRGKQQDLRPFLAQAD